MGSPNKPFRPIPPPRITSPHFTRRRLRLLEFYKLNPKRCLTQHNNSLTATLRRRNFDLTPLPSHSDREAASSDEASNSVSMSTTKKGKGREGESPPLPRLQGERHQSRTPLAPPLLHSSPPPRSKRRRSRTPAEDHSKHLVGHSNLFPSRLRSPSESSRKVDSYRPSKSFRCDNYGCGGRHSHNDCPLPMRCCGCHSIRHFYVNCPQICVGCGHIRHSEAYCSDFVVGTDGRSRPLEWDRDYARKRQRQLHNAPSAQKSSDRPQHSPDLRSDSLQRHSTQPSNLTRSSSFEPKDAPVKSSQRLAFEEEESIKQARHEADMARHEANMSRKAAAQKLELEHEVRLLEVRRQYATGLLPSNATYSSVLYPPYDPNGPLVIPDYLSAETSLTMNAPAAVSGYQRRGGEQRIKIEEDIKYVIID